MTELERLKSERKKLGDTMEHMTQNDSVWQEACKQYSILNRKIFDIEQAVHQRSSCSSAWQK